MMSKYKDMSDYCWTIDEPDMAEEWLAIDKRIEELEEALKYYASPEPWKLNSDDFGQIAEQALNGEDDE